MPRMNDYARGSIRNTRDQTSTSRARRHLVQRQEPGPVAWRRGRGIGLRHTHPRPAWLAGEPDSAFPARSRRQSEGDHRGRWLSGSVEQLALKRDRPGCGRWLRQLVRRARPNRPEFPQHLIGKCVRLDLIISSGNLTRLAEPMKSFVCEDGSG